MKERPGSRLASGPFLMHAGSKASEARRGPCAARRRKRCTAMATPRGPRARLRLKCQLHGVFLVPRKSSQDLLPKNIEQDTEQGLSSQFAERTGSGLQACSSSKELRGLSARAHVRV